MTQTTVLTSQPTVLTARTTVPAVLTAQQAYDKALFGIRQQNYEQSASAGGTCAYRGEAGMKCAVGHCIDDETAIKWDKGVRGSTNKQFGIGHMFEYDKETYLKFFQESDVELLRKLQDIHDRIPITDRGYGQYFEAKMQELAEDFNLVYTPV
jgi:hypothetical protein